MTKYKYSMYLTQAWTEVQAMFMLYERNCKHEYDKSTLVNIAGKT